MPKVASISNGTLTALRSLGTLSVALALTAPLTACDDAGDPTYADDFTARAAPVGDTCDTGIRCDDEETLLETPLEDEEDGVDEDGGFDWGSVCDDGSDDFNQPIAHQATVTLGDIPPGKGAVRVDLSSAADVDIQLVDKSTGHAIVAWPHGDVSRANEGCATYSGVEYCYSGYNGVGGNLGEEWIEIRDVTNRTLTMKAFGYAAGDAVVEYGWEAPEACADAGSGTFSQNIAHQAVVEVGRIPVGKNNIKIDLDSPVDVDIQLFAGTTEIVRWPDGILNGAGQESTTYNGIKITWSGYNGVNGQPGDEYIWIEGEVSTELTVKAFGYAAGQATVNYQWGLPDNAF